MKESIIDNIKLKRKEKNITQEKLAEKLDISRAKVSSWETNRRDMNIFEAIKLSSILDISIEKLFEIEKISEEQYLEIFEKFIRCNNIKLQDKVKLIETIKNRLKQNNIDEFYENYKMTQNATK